MQELKEGLKKLLEKKRELTKSLDDVNAQIDHVQQALGISAMPVKTRKPRQKKIVDGQYPEVDEKPSRVAKQVDFTSFRSEAREP